MTESRNWPPLESFKNYHDMLFPSIVDYYLGETSSKLEIFHSKKYKSTEKEGGYTTSILTGELLEKFFVPGIDLALMYSTDFKDLWS